MNCSSEVFQLRKAGLLDEALKKAREAFAANPNDIWLQHAYGWVIYDLVKREVLLFEQHKSPPGKLANRFNEWLAEYRQFGTNERPGLLHSRLLEQVIKGSKAWPYFLDFARWWGSEYMRPEDKQPFMANNGKQLPSLELRLFYAIGRETTHHVGGLDADLLNWGKTQLESALESFPNDQWLHYYKSKALLDEGKVEDARHCLMPVVRRQQRAAWVWTLLGHTFESQDPDKSLTCYFRAVQVAAQPQEVANTRISLAHLLAGAERFEEATVQIRLALEYRQSNNYSVPQALIQLTGSDWYRSFSKRTDLPAEPDVTEQIDLILFGELKYYLGVIESQNVMKELAYVAFNPENGAVLLYRKFKGILNVAVGDLIEVAMDGNKAIRWRATSITEIPGFCIDFDGELSQRAGQPFGFIITDDRERIYVHPSVMKLKSVAPDSRVSCRAIMSKDKQGKPGWRALRWN